MTIGLSIDTRLIQNADDKIKEHERGHAQICQRIYACAEPAAYDAAKASLGHLFAGEGRTEAEAVQNALNRAAKFVCSAYRTKTSAVADAVSAIYDHLTQHSRSRLKATIGVDKAFENYKVLYFRPADNNR